MTIFQALRDDHEHQRTLVKALTETSGASSERERIFTELKGALNAHAIAEERHFYAPLVQSDLTQEKSRHGIAEHKELDDLVETLEATDPSSPAWLTQARLLEERLLHHLEEEEREVFQLAGKVLPDARKSELAEAYRAEMTARTAS